MKQAACGEYERAKRLALASIEAQKERAQLREPPSADALLRTIEEKAKRGEPPTEEDIATLAAAMATKSPSKRRRGRPKGTQDRAAKSAFFSACLATQRCDLKNYRNNASGHRMTRCDALAEAMNEAGFNSLTTYDAAAAEMKALRRSIRKAVRLAAAWRALSERGQSRMASLSEIDAQFTSRTRRLALRLSEKLKKILEATR